LKKRGGQVLNKGWTKGPGLQPHKKNTKKKQTLLNQGRKEKLLKQRAKGGGGPNGHLLGPEGKGKRKLRKKKN